VVAQWQAEHAGDHAFVLGTMLPDLTAMMGLRLTGVGEASVAAGVACHHSTDAAFHGCAPFVRMCHESVDKLTAAGVERGTARAVAHVGIELLLDGVLSRNSEAIDAYKGALAFAVERRLADTLTWPEEQRARMHVGLERLVRAPVPEGYREPGFVVDRLEYILARRPRLAIRPSDLPHVSARIAQLHDEIATVTPVLLDDVRRRMRPAL
jgi:acyl carrier protein phosphodiesterase